MTKILLLSMLLAAVGCYGAATPDSCHRKYILNQRGNASRDTYAACMTRANAIEHGVPVDVEALRERVVFETGCQATTIKVFEHQGNAATVVGAEACGQRLTYARKLRHRLGTRTARGTQWDLVSASTVGPSSAAAPSMHVPAPTERVFGTTGGAL